MRAREKERAWSSRNLSCVDSLARFWRAASYRSSGFKPVVLARRANIRGPISSSSWNANTTSVQPGRQDAMGAGLTFYAPSDPKKRGEDPPGFCGGPMPHAAANETLTPSGAISPHSNRSATTRRAKACAFALACSGVSPYANTPGNSSTSANQRPSTSCSISTLNVILAPITTLKVFYQISSLHGVVKSLPLISKIWEETVSLVWRALAGRTAFMALGPMKAAPVCQACGRCLRYS